VAAKAKFDDFITGFNQAAERFIMLDVGSAKEGADAKIKGITMSLLFLENKYLVAYFTYFLGSVVGRRN